MRSAVALRSYPDAMSLPARVVAAAVRERLPGVGVKKLHKLLYYCQGHHLATFGRPLFDETLSAWDMGPVVGSLWYEEKQSLPAADASPELGEAELNTLGYVLSRYGRLSGRELEVLSHAEDPWKQADRHRHPGASARIEPEWLRTFFASNLGDDDDIPLDSEVVSAWLSNAAQGPPGDRVPDDPQRLRARLRRD